MIKVSIHNVDVVFKRVAALGTKAPDYMFEVLDRAMSLDVWPLWIKEISLSDHSLQDLANEGHPYSTRYAANSFVHPDSEVHEQSGDLVAQSSIVKQKELMSIQLKNASTHYKFIRYGTKLMRMRDPGGAALREALPHIKKRFADEIKNAIIDIAGR